MPASSVVKVYSGVVSFVGVVTGVTSEMVGAVVSMVILKSELALDTCEDKSVAVAVMTCAPPARLDDVQVHTPIGVAVVVHTSALETSSWTTTVASAWAVPATVGVLSDVVPFVA